MRVAGARRAVLVAAGLAFAAALVACRQEEPTVAPSDGASLDETGGTLEWALAAAPSQLDPLLATSRPDQLVTRQVHEPLTAELAGPFGDVRRVPGLALSAAASADQTIWRLRLRRGVRFQDGSPFNAAAVVANAERWRSSAEGKSLLPGLVASDAPRPDLVRFVLSRRDPNFDRDLAQSRLGIVAPRALGRSQRLRRNLESGTGPYEIRELGPRGALVARNTEWWGSRRSLDLGPALDQVEFPVVEDGDERLARLAAGRAQVASDLGPSQLRELRRDPLLTVVRGLGGTGAERSVRGIEGSGVPSLSGAWLTTIDSR
jgi:peptide/nickel transport system substrate-binding protein